MNSVIDLIARAGKALHPAATLALIVMLNVQWTVTLQAFGRQFEQSTGAGEPGAVPALSADGMRR